MYWTEQLIQTTSILSCTPSQGELFCFKSNLYLTSRLQFRPWKRTHYVFNMLSRRYQVNYRYTLNKVPKQAGVYNHLLTTRNLRPNWVHPSVAENLVTGR